MEKSPKGCAPHICYCYCCRPTGSEVSSSSFSATNKVEAVHPSNWQGCDGHVPSVGGDNTLVKEEGGVPLKSNLKKPSPGSIKETTADKHTSPNRSPVTENCEHGETNTNSKRKVQWTDAHGQELTQVKEFERSDSGWSDDEYIRESNESCQCVIQWSWASMKQTKMV